MLTQLALCVACLPPLSLSVSLAARRSFDEAFSVMKVRWASRRLSSLARG